jgi:manganese peroxidase
MMKQANGQCNQLARASVRLAFHDAGAWDKNQVSGGADGSFILNNVEIAQSVNNGLQNVTATAQALLAKYRVFGVSAADLVQFMGVIGIVTCPGGPRMRWFVGRPDNSAPNNFTLLPDVNAPAEDLITLFENKNIASDLLVGLVGAHTSGNQFFFNTAKSGSSFDPTPGIWDASTFYSFVLNGGTAP